MEKLQIKHIAPYLPYGLKCQCRDLGRLELTSVSTINIAITSRSARKRIYQYYYLV